MMENDLALPFATLVLGVEVTVERIDLTEADEIVAICARGARVRLFRSSSCRCLYRRLAARSGSGRTGGGPLLIGDG